MSEVVFKDKNIRKAINDLSQHLDEIEGRKKQYVVLLSNIVFKDIMLHFDRETGPKGKWRKWSDVTKAHYAKIGKLGNKKLQDTGVLRNSFKPTSFKKAAGGVVFINDTDYARTHDQGDRSRNIPQRQFMWLSAPAMRDMEKQTLQFLTTDLG